MAGCWEKEGMAGLCNCCRQVEGMRWREGGRETGSRREGRAEREICGDYSVSTRPEQREPRGQSPEARAHLRPAGRRSVQGREGWWRCQRREMVLSWTMKGCGWPVAREGGVGSLVVPMANNQARRAGLAGKPPKVRPKVEQAQRTSGKQTERGSWHLTGSQAQEDPRINRPSPRTPSRRRVDATTRRAREWVMVSERPRCRISPIWSCSVSNAPHPGTKWRKAAGWLPVATPTREAVERLFITYLFPGLGIPDLQVDQIRVAVAAGPGMRCSKSGFSALVSYIFRFCRPTSYAMLCLRGRCGVSCHKRCPFVAAGCVVGSLTAMRKEAVARFGSTDVWTLELPVCGVGWRLAGFRGMLNPARHKRQVFWGCRALQSGNQDGEKGGGYEALLV